MELYSGEETMRRWLDCVIFKHWLSIVRLGYRGSFLKSEIKEAVFTLGGDRVPSPDEFFFFNTFGIL